MGANSIRTNLTRESTISEIRLCRSADLHHQLTHLVVEGTDDIRFLQNNVSSSVNLYESFSGKLGVLEIIEFFNDSNVIGICDRDYDIGNAPPHIFYYDYSCLETMMLSSFESFKRACTTLYLNFTNIEEIYNQAFYQIRLLTSFRKINHQNNWAMNFSCISLFKAFDSSKRAVDISKVISQLREANQSVFSANPQIIHLAGLEAKKFSSIEDDLLNANGHDVLAMLHCLCKIPKSTDYNENIIRIALILSYNFQNSSLFLNLRKYEHEQNLKIVS